MTITDERVWRTKDKRVILIADMEDEHLLNSIEMLKRNGYCTIAAYDAGCAALGSQRGEMAQYYAEQEMTNAKPCHELDWLIEEAKRRGILKS